VVFSDVPFDGDECGRQWLLLRLLEATTVEKKVEKSNRISKTMIVSVAFPQIGQISQAGIALALEAAVDRLQTIEDQRGFSPVISAGQVLGCLIMFVVMYLLFFVLFLFYSIEKSKRHPNDRIMPPSIFNRTHT